MSIPSLAEVDLSNLQALKTKRDKLIEQLAKAEAKKDDHTPEVFEKVKSKIESKLEDVEAEIRELESVLEAQRQAISMASEEEQGKIEPSVNPNEVREWLISSALLIADEVEQHRKTKAVIYEKLDQLEEKLAEYSDALQEIDLLNEIGEFAEENEYLAKVEPLKEHVEQVDQEKVDLFAQLNSLEKQINELNDQASWCEKTSEGEISGDIIDKYLKATRPEISVPEEAAKIDVTSEKHDIYTTPAQMEESHEDVLVEPSRQVAIEEEEAFQVQKTLAILPEEPGIEQVAETEIEQPDQPETWRAVSQEISDSSQIGVSSPEATVPLIEQTEEPSPVSPPINPDEVRDWLTSSELLITDEADQQRKAKAAVCEKLDQLEEKLNEYSDAIQEIDLLNEIGEFKEEGEYLAKLNPLKENFELNEREKADLIARLDSIEKQISELDAQASWWKKASEGEISDDIIDKYLKAARAEIPAPEEAEKIYVPSEEQVIYLPPAHMEKTQEAISDESPHKVAVQAMEPAFKEEGAEPASAEKVALPSKVSDYSSEADIELLAAKTGLKRKIIYASVIAGVLIIGGIAVGKFFFYGATQQPSKPKGKNINVVDIGQATPAPANMPAPAPQTPAPSENLKPAEKFEPAAPEKEIPTEQKAWVKIKIEPPDAKIYLDKKYLGLGSALDKYEIPANQSHTIRFAKEGYAEQTMPVKVQPGNVQAVSVVLEKQIGFVSISPDIGCSITLDGKAIGSSPLAKYQVDAGAHTVLLVNEKLSIAEIYNIQVKHDEIKYLTPKFFAKLNITTLNPWAEVKLDGSLIGTTPLIKDKITPGSHTLVLFNPDSGKTVQKNLVLKPGMAVIISSWE